MSHKLTYKVHENLLNKVTAEQAHNWRVIPITIEEGEFCLGTDLWYVEREEELELFLGERVRLVEVDGDWLSVQLQKYYRQSRSNTLGANEDFLEMLIAEAQDLGSSDIHIEPLETNGRVRLRLDGKLIERFTIEANEYPSLVNKIKVRAHLDISEKRLPQDGRISLLEKGLDLRVSTLPVLNGEKVVLRLLGKTAGQLQLEQLGMNSSQLELYNQALKNPHGIILISGPTGSGKTTTLYATLQNMKDVSRNIMTIEDPIEYTFNGIAQVQVREQIGLDFPTALKSFLRQDPDIIMIGEIRDTETAEMAIRASLTGHLVFSTIHTNNAWDTITRLQDMGIPDYLVLNTLQISVAQRLVRLLCPECKEEIENKEKALFGKFHTVSPDKMYKATGCEACHYTGYKGRKAMYELLPLTTELKRDLKEQERMKDEVYAKYKVISLAEQALQLIKEGATSLEETQTYFLEH